MFDVILPVLRIWVLHQTSATQVSMSTDLEFYDFSDRVLVLLSELRLTVKFPFLNIGVILLNSAKHTDII